MEASKVVETLTYIGVAIGSFLLAKGWEWLVSIKSKLELLTLAITELRVEMRHTREQLQIMPKLQKDVDQAHEKIRTLEDI